MYGFATTSVAPGTRTPAFPPYYRCGPGANVAAVPAASAGGTPAPQTTRPRSRDLLQPVRASRALDAGDDVLPRHRVPAHALRDRVAALDEPLELLGRAREPLDQVGRHPLGDRVLDGVALGLADV